MSALYDLVDFAALDAAFALGHVVRREHPALPLAILNYTDRCQYEPGAWTAVTRQCRGIIYDTMSGEIVARPFPKFFNYGQREAPTLDLSAPVHVSDKLDGSLGILYRISNSEYAIATRGSFISDQAIHATELWNDRYASRWAPPLEWTALFEIVYPANRIVLDYAGLDDLIFLGAVENDTGRTWGAGAFGFPGPHAKVFGYSTLADALAAPPRPNAEGLVCLFENGERLKVKQEDYVALHRIVTGLNERTVWEHLVSGKPLDDLIAPLPDEFHAWVREVAGRIQERVDCDIAVVEEEYASIVRSLPEGFSRKDFALMATGHEMAWALFNRLTGKDYRPALLKNAKPEAFQGPRGVTYSEDTA